MRHLSLFVFFVLLASGCASQNAGYLAIHAEDPVSIWKTPAGYAPEAKVYFIAANGDSKVVMDTLEYPIAIGKARRELMTYGRQTIDYFVEIKTDIYGENPELNMILSLVRGDERDMLHRSTPFDPETARVYEPAPPPEPEPRPDVPPPPPAKYTLEDMDFALTVSDYGDQKIINIKATVINKNWGIKQISTSSDDSSMVISFEPGEARLGASRGVGFDLLWRPGTAIYFEDSSSCIYTGGDTEE